jgi:DNA-binding transcriptional LysR family regulator
MADQNRATLDWEDVRVFVALARHGSLSGAARALAINHGTVSRRILALEAAVGEKLVERRPDGYVLTPFGTRMLGPASDMEAAAAVLARGGADDRPRGLVRVNAPPSVSQGFLVERLAKLSVEYPGLDIDVATDVRAVSLDRRETDIALRYAKPQDGDVIARLLSIIGFGLYATTEYQARINAGEELAFVGFDELNAHLPEAVWLGRHFPRARVSFRTNNQLAQAAAARVHAGVAMLPHFVGSAFPTLRPLQLEHNPPARELWLITRKQDRKDTSIHTVAEYLMQIFVKERALFEGSTDAGVNGEIQGNPGCP